ncbi:MAG: FKBP-type peptidyl-prolyl cis-trans isomerase [Chitinophagales bacterium]
MLVCITQSVWAQISFSDMNEAQKAGYAYGINLAQNLKKQGASDLDLAMLLKGIEDAMSDKDLLLSYEESAGVLNTYFTQAREKQLQKNLNDGKAFLAENKDKKGVSVTSSGLQYTILKEGNGPKPSATSTVTTHYEGKLLDGTVFDSSYERGEPATFALNRVIPGWTEALQLMPEGSKWRLYIPSELAYGERGAGESIEPNSVLIFDVELLKVGQ